MPGVPVGFQEFLVVVMRLAVPAVTQFARLDMNRQEHEDQEGHRRLHRQEREHPGRKQDASGGGFALEEDAGHFVGDRKDGQRAENVDLLSGKDLRRPGVHEIHDQRAQEQVHKNVEGEEASRVDAVEGRHDQGIRFFRILQKQAHGADDVAVEEEHEHQENRGRRAAVPEQLLPEPFGIVQDPREVRHQQEGQGHFSDVADDVADSRKPLRVGRVQFHGNLHQRHDHGNHDTRPAQDLERLE